MARPPTDPAIVAEALALVDGNTHSVEEAAREMARRGRRVGHRTLYRAIEARREAAKAAPVPAAPPQRLVRVRPAAKAPPAAAASPVAPEPPPSDPGGGIDSDGTPLEIARQLLQRVTSSMATLEADSPRLNPARAEARQLAKLIQQLEREVAKEPTADEIETERRRADGDTRREIERYTDQAIGLALRPAPDAPHGRCPTCTSPLAADQRAAMFGAP